MRSVVAIKNNIINSFANGFTCNGFICTSCENKR